MRKKESKKESKRERKIDRKRESEIVMKRVLIVLTLIIMVFVGCQKEESGNISEETQAITLETLETTKAETATKAQETEQATTIAETTPVEVPEVLDESVSSKMDTFVADKDLKGAWALFESMVPSTNEPTAEYLLLQFIVLAQEQEFDASDSLFGDMGNKAQQMIYVITDANADDFDYRHVIIADDKYDLLVKMSGDEQVLIQEVFDKGYGLINAEGSYYAVVDYSELVDRYGDYFTEPTRNMLETFKDILINQTTVEEYLAITPNKLMERSIALEQHLIDYPSAPDLYKTMVRRNLNICLSKLAFPSPFDGGVDEDGTLSPAFEAVYNQLLNEQVTPVVTQIAIEITQWISTRENGYVGAYNDMEDLYTVTGGIYGRATEMVTKLY